MNHYSHSTETTIVRVKNYIMMLIDQGKLTLLVLQDVPGAFDTVDTNVLIIWLKDMVCLSGKVIEWFQSYLEQHLKNVSVHGILSDFQLLLFRMPQVQFLVLWVLQCTPIRLVLLLSNIALNITCMLMTHSCIYNWILTIN